jgi:hypothetical protein
MSTVILTIRLTQAAANAKRHYQSMMISVVSLDNKDYKNKTGLDFPRNDDGDEDNCNKERHLEVNKERRLKVLMPSVQLQS